MLKSLRKILCVDDENDIVQVVKLALENVGGYEVVACSSGREALERVEEFNPDLILLDAMMPQMDGPTTLQELHRHQAWKVIPIVFMTARVQPREVQEYIDLGASGVISKPFDPMTLSQEIAQQWEKFHAGRKKALEAMMAPLRQEYLAQMRGTLAALDEALPRLAAQTLPPEALTALIQKAHHLSGSGATYGFEDLSRTARAFELALKEKEPPAEPARLAAMLADLKGACEQALQKAA